MIASAQRVSFVSSNSPSLALSSRPTGPTNGRSAPARQSYTVPRSCGSLRVVTRPRGLLSARYTWATFAMRAASTSITACSGVTRWFASRTITPSTRTRPAATRRSPSAREQWPSLESARARLTVPRGVMRNSTRSVPTDAIAWPASFSRQRPSTEPALAETVAHEANSAKVIGYTQSRTPSRRSRQINHPSSPYGRNQLAWSATGNGIPTSGPASKRVRAGEIASITTNTRAIG